MTIFDLIEALRQYPRGMRVVLRGMNEFGFCDPQSPIRVGCKGSTESPSVCSYDEADEVIDDDDFEAVLIDFSI